MKIGIIGAGNIGIGLGKRLVPGGHDIVVSFARTPDKVALAAQTIGGSARPGTPEEAARHGEVVILATPWAVTLDTVRAVAESLAGRIIWDTTNPLKPDMSGLAVGLTTSAGELIAQAAPAGMVVKAIPPFAEVLNSPAPMADVLGQRPTIFVCGDDDAARSTILPLVAAIDADGVDAGPLASARYTEPAGMLLVQLAYAQGLGPLIGSSLLRASTPHS